MQHFSSGIRGLARCSLSSFSLSRNRDENWGEGSGQLSFTPGSGGHYNARKIDEEEENRWATQGAWFTAAPRVPGPKKKKSWYR
ncbi:hypothetical protein niasHT_004018 [Heterodera trifolii]